MQGCPAEGHFVTDFFLNMNYSDLTGEYPWNMYGLPYCFMARACNVSKLTWWEVICRDKKIVRITWRQAFASMGDLANLIIHRVLQPTLLLRCAARKVRNSQRVDILSLACWDGMNYLIVRISGKPKSRLFWIDGGINEISRIFSHIILGF